MKIAQDPNTPPSLLVVDEGTMSLDKYDPSQYWITKSSRHWGHSAIIISHNLTDTAKQIRTQCTQIFILGCSRSDAAALIDEFDDDRIAYATKLPTFHFVQILSKESKVRFGKVDPNTDQIMVYDDIKKLGLVVDKSKKSR